MKLAQPDLDLFRRHIESKSEWMFTCCTDYGDFDIDILDNLQNAAQSNHFDTEEIIYGDGWNYYVNLYEIALDYVDNYDPTPYCGYCKSATKAGCSCPD